MIFRNDATMLNDRHYVICSSCALARNGLTTMNPEFLVVFTRSKKLNMANFGVAQFVYNSKINYTDFVIPIENNHCLLLPNKERAIIESILHIDSCDEGELIEAINTYLLLNKDCTKLYEMAKFFKLGEKILDYWINEAKNDYEI